MSSEGKCIKIRYHGHACFSIEWRDSVIVIDPHDGDSIGKWPKPSVKGDLILVTHNHFDHNAVNLVVKDDSMIVRSFAGKETLNLKGKPVVLEGYRVPHDRLGGVRRGLTSVYRLWLDDIIVIHMGDIGTMTCRELFKKLANPRPDVLMVPVGGNFTIEPFEAWEVVEKLNPVIAIPMHFWVPGVRLPMAPVNEFLAAAKTGRELVEREYIYCKKEQASDKPKIIVIRVPRVRY